MSEGRVRIAVVVIFLVIVLVLAVSLSLTIKRDKLRSITDWESQCLNLFYTKSFPIPKANDGFYVKLCHNFDGSSEVYLATLYNTITRTPVYTANKVRRRKNAKEESRPKFDWNISRALCQNDLNTNMMYLADAVSPKKNNIQLNLENCKRNQALDEDYKNNTKNLNRKHLSPSGINNQHKEKQLSTFTLTNIAPQKIDFNKEAWAKYETMVKDLIEFYAEDKDVYIITRTRGVLVENGVPVILKGRVTVPEYFWKAVCYPDQSRSWSFAIEQRNADGIEANAANFLSVEDLSDKLFDEGNPMMGERCMKTNCTNAKSKIKELMKFSQN